VSDEQHPLDELAVYALDALDDDERLVVEAHLARCPACATIVDEHRATLAALTADEPPPPAVWQRIAAQTGAGDVPTPLAVMPSARSTPTAPGPSLPAPDRPPPAPPTHLRPRRSRGSRRSGGSAPPGRWVAISGVAAAAALVVGGVVGVAIASRDDEPANLADLAAAAMEQPGASVATLAASDDGRDAARVVADGSTGYIVLDDLPTLPSGQAYQLWRLGGDAPVSLGVIGDGRQHVATVGIPAGTDMLALSTEPADGSVAPTGDIVATGSFA
jgi:anti-sigma-K factor RskA